CDRDVHRGYYSRPQLYLFRAWRNQLVFDPFMLSVCGGESGYWNDNFVGGLAPLVQTILCYNHSGLYSARCSAFLGCYNISPIHFRIAYFYMEFLCDYGVSVPLVVLRVMCKRVDRESAF